AEDGIGDFHVTGVQTRALPILTVPIAAAATEIGTVTSLPMPSGSVPSVLAGASASSAQPTAKVDRPRASTTSSARDRAIRGRWGEDNTVTSNRVRPLPEREIGRASCRERAWVVEGAGT